MSKVRTAPEEISLKDLQELIEMSSNGSGDAPVWFNPESYIEAIKTGMRDLELQIEFDKKSRQRKIDLAALLPGENPNIGMPLSIRQDTDEDEQSLGALNLLLDNAPVVSRWGERTFRAIIQSMIRETNGLVPKSQVELVFSEDGKNVEYRAVTRWTIPRAITFEEIAALYHIMTILYGADTVAGVKDGKWESVGTYRSVNGMLIPRRPVIYFGSTGANFSSLSCGLTISRFFPSSEEAEFVIHHYPGDWFHRIQTQRTKIHTYVEFREGGNCPHPEYIFANVQIAQILKTRGLRIPEQALWTMDYRRLNKIGLTGFNPAMFHSIEEPIRQIERAMLLPIEQPALAKALNLKSESVLLAGVPGTGKTQMGLHLISRGYYAIFIALTSNRLRGSLMKDSGTELQTQINLIRQRIGPAVPIILMFDDVDVVSEDDVELSTALMNILQGFGGTNFIIFATTNSPWKMDPRLFQYGRLSIRVHMPLPNEQERLGLLLVHSRELAFEPEKDRIVTLEKIAKETGGWVARDFVDLVDEVRRIIAEEVTDGNIQYAVLSAKDLYHISAQPKHFKKAFETVKTRVNTKGTTADDLEIQKHLSRQVDRTPGFKKQG